MLNAIESYEYQGRQTAKARNERDEARATFEKQYAVRMWNLETVEDRAKAQAAFNEAYRVWRRA